MGKTNLGRVTVVPCGSYDNAVAYKRLDIVEYEGGSYLFLKDSVGIVPTGDNEVTMLLSAKGEKGDAFTYEDFTPEQLAVLKGEKGDTGKGFTVLGYYGNLDLLKAAVANPEPGDAYGIGTKEPYDIYVFDGVTDDWVDNGKIGGDGEGKMVLIPGDVLNLTNASTSNEILDAFGSKEAFIDIVRKVKEGRPVAIRQGNSYGALTYALVNFDAGIEPEQGIYQLGFTFINSLPDERGNFVYVFNLQNDVIQLVLKEETPLGYANIVNIPSGIFSLNSDSTSEQIIFTFGGRASFDSIIEKLRIGNAVGIISGPSAYASIDQISVAHYTDANNLTLTINFMAGDGLFARNIIVSNGTFACTAIQYSLLFAENLVSNPSTGGTDRPASAEAVKVLKDTKVSSANIRTIQKLTQAEYDSLSTKDDNTLYIIIN